MCVRERAKQQWEMRRAVFIFVPGHEKSRARQPKFMLSCSLKWVWWRGGELQRARAIIILQLLGCLNEHRQLGPWCALVTEVCAFCNHFSMEHTAHIMYAESSLRWWLLWCAMCGCTQCHRNLFAVSFKKSRARIRCTSLWKSGARNSLWVGGVDFHTATDRESPDLYSSVRCAAAFNRRALSLLLMQ